ncbi:MAG: M23 family metallopeptidase, partial [Oscillospiraceae bacterium]|nr:M23 family metallopeptidase [Oscillospiraceae bacterium]
TVYAAKSGTVIVSTYNNVRGNYVTISHGSGNTTLYQHLSKRSVKVGDVVKQGDPIGVTGSSGVGSGPHLHFEITENGKLIDPLIYLKDYRT